MGHRPTLLPDGPTQNPYTDASWATLLAILEAILPSIRREAAGAAGAEPVWQRSISDEEYHRTLDHLTATMVDAPNGDDWARYLAERLSEIPRFQDLLRRTLGVYAHADARRGLGVLLAALKYVVGHVSTNSPILACNRTTDVVTVPDWDASCSPATRHPSTSNLCTSGRRSCADGETPTSPFSTPSTPR